MKAASIASKGSLSWKQQVINSPVNLFFYTEAFYEWSETSGVLVLSSLGSDLVVPARLHLVYGLVAVVPGVQLLVSGVVVDAAVAGVALREEQHGTLIAVDEGHRREELVRDKGSVGKELF